MGRATGNARASNTGSSKTGKRKTTVDTSYRPLIHHPTAAATNTANGLSTVTADRVSAGSIGPAGPASPTHTLTVVMSLDGATASCQIIRDGKGVAQSTPHADGNLILRIEREVGNHLAAMCNELLKEKRSR